MMVMMPVTLPQPHDEILKIEAFLDAIEPKYPPNEPTDKNPLDIDHFELLGLLGDCQGDDGESDPGAVTDVVPLTRHYLNALRQFCAGERDKAAMSKEMERLRAKIEELTPKA